MINWGGGWLTCCCLIQDDGTDDTYATLTCSDGIMYLKYYADSSCKYSVDEYEFTAGGA